MLNIRDIVDTFATNLETRIRESIMNSLNGTYDKPTHSSVPNVESAPRKKMMISKARRSQLKLTGRYMGSLRSLNKKDQGAVKAENKKNGMTSAIALAGRLKAKAVKKEAK